MKVLAEAKESCCRHNLVQQDFPAKRTMRRRKASGELYNGEIEENQTIKYRQETFIYSNIKPISARLSLLMVYQIMHSIMWPITTVSVHSI